MSKFFTSTLALALAVVSVNAGFGQKTEIQPPQVRTATTRPASQSQLDRPMVEFFASKLVLCNNAEIQMGQMVAGKSTNSEVKKFAEMLAVDHAKFNEQLKPFVASYGEIPAVATSASDAEKVTANKPVVTDRQNAPAQTEKNVPATSETNAVSGAHAVLERLYEVCQAAHQNQLAAGKEMLSKKSAAEFDKAFMGSQVVGHMVLLSELKALESQSPQDFQAIIRSAKESVQAHMQKAESICKSLAVQNDKTETSNR